MAIIAIFATSIEIIPLPSAPHKLVVKMTKAKLIIRIKNLETSVFNIFLKNIYIFNFYFLEKVFINSINLDSIEFQLYLFSAKRRALALCS